MNDPLLDEEFSEKDQRPIGLFSTRIMVVGCLLLSLGLVFKIQHWPMQAFMILGGCGLASGSSAYRALAIQNTPVERAMRLFIPILTVCILFFWLQYTLVGFGLFTVSAIIASILDYTAIKRR